MSATTAKALDIAIMGRTYKVSCHEEERESLLEAVAYLDQKMGEIKSSGRVGNAERIAVMAALNIAHELLEARARGSAPQPAATVLTCRRSSVEWFRCRRRSIKRSRPKRSCSESAFFLARGQARAGAARAGQCPLRCA